MGVGVEKNNYKKAPEKLGEEGKQKFELVRPHLTSILRNYFVKKMATE